MKVTCPHCQKKMSIKKELPSGKKFNFNCPACGGKITISTPPTTPDFCLTNEEIIKIKNFHSHALQKNDADIAKALLMYNDGMNLDNISKILLIERKIAEDIILAGMSAIEKSVSILEDSSGNITPVDDIEIFIGCNLIPLVIGEGRKLTDSIKYLRERFLLQYGWEFESVRVLDDMMLQGDEYVIYIKGEKIKQHRAKADKMLAIDYSAVETPLAEHDVKEPLTGTPSVWIEKNDSEKYITAGYTVYDADFVIVRVLEDVIRLYGFSLFAEKNLRELIQNHGLDADFLDEDDGPGFFRLINLLLFENFPINNMEHLIERYGHMVLLQWPLYKMILSLRQEKIPSLLEPFTINETIGYYEIPENLLNRIKDMNLNGDEITLTEEESFKDITSEILKLYWPLPLFIVDSEIRLLTARIFRHALRDPNVMVLTHDEIPENITLFPIG